jgi:hypothetical protein
MIDRRAISVRALALAAVLVAGGCGLNRLEDVPTTAALDGRAASLASPPADLIAPARSGTVDAHAAAAGAVPAAPVEAKDEVPSLAAAEPPPVEPSVTWIVRYRDEGFDAEDRQGNVCSGRADAGSASFRAGAAIALACSDGRAGILRIASVSDGRGRGYLALGKSEEPAQVFGP